MKVIRKEVFEFIVVFTEGEFEALKAASMEFGNKMEDMLLWIVDNKLREYNESLE